MFKDITITFSEPICACKAQAAKWHIIAQENDKFTLHVWCKTCDIEMMIPSSQLYARFEFDKPYDTVLEEEVVSHDGKVIKVDFTKR